MQSVINTNLPISEPAIQAMLGEAAIEARNRVELRRRDLARHYQPRGECLALQHNGDREIVISGPAGTGKSRACLEKLNHYAWEYPGSRYLIVRKTRASLSESAMQTYETHVLGEGNPIATGPNRPFRQYYKYPNGSMIILGGMDKATRIMSTEYDLIYVQEAIELSLDEWESLTTRTRNYKTPIQQLIADTNPGAPTHWIRQRVQLGHTTMLHSQHTDNPVLWDEAAGDWTAAGADYITRLDALTGSRRDRLRFGKWVQAEGAIYPMFDPSIHAIHRFDIPADWPRYRSIDFGYNNPFVCQWWAVDPDGRLYLYREIYMTERLVEDHAAQINELSQGENIMATVADHDAEGRATLNRYGVPTMAANKAVLDGIQAVAQRLRVKGDGRPSICFLRDSLVETDHKLKRQGKPISTIDEIPGYIWQPTTDKRTKEQPVKVDDHGCDTIRYMVTHIDKYGDPADWVIRV